MSESVYRRMRQELGRKRRLAPNLGLLLLDGALMVVAFGWNSYWIEQVVCALIAFHGFVFLHDCGHGGFSRRPWVNVVFGHVFGFLCGLPFYSWKYIHAGHHQWAGNVDRDPTLAGLKRMPTGVSLFLLRLGWKGWVPLIALNQHVLFWSYPMRSSLSARQKRQCFVSSILLVLAYAAVIVKMGVLWFLPAVILFLLLTELVSAPHHLGLPTVGGNRRLPLWEQAGVTRSSYFPAPLSEILFLNFNFHIEHHLFPDLPWYRLREVRKRVCAAATSRYQEETGLRWSFANRRRDIVDVLRGVPLRRRPRGTGGSRSSKWMRKAVLALPEPWRFILYRQAIRLDWRPPPALRVKLAETESEKTEAFRLLHDAYVKEGLMEPEESRMRVTRYHSLPTTVTLIALWGEEVVGTIGIIQDSPLGLPMEAAFDLSAYRGAGKRIAEVSAFAVRKDFQGNAGRVVFPLTKMMWEHSVSALRLDMLMAAVHPKRADFYRAILLMEKVSDRTVAAYGFANDNPAVGLTLDLHAAWDRAYETYCGKSAQRDLYRYYACVRLSHLNHSP